MQYSTGVYRSSFLLQWLDSYIDSIAGAPHLFNLIEFEDTLARHINEIVDLESVPCTCVQISSQPRRDFWDALTTFVHEAIERVRRASSRLGFIAITDTNTHRQIHLLLSWGRGITDNSNPLFVPLYLNVPDASMIIPSSDQVNFRVHKSLLDMSSPFFEDMLSLPQPSDDETIDGLTVVQLSEDAGVLNCLISLLYPISTIIPGSYERVFALLAACQKYEMVSTQSYIRAEIQHGTYPALVAAEAFTAYAIASSMGLVLEADNAARLTIGQPLTFESLGECLRSFKGRALSELVQKIVQVKV